MRGKDRSTNGEGLDRAKTLLPDVDNIDKEFLSYINLDDMEPEFFNGALEKFDLITFDAF
jgi:hypothetical protein